jgi:hypothetical protein
LRWLSRHQTALVVIGILAVLWGSLWLFYDYRSPVSQLLRGIGTAQMDGWSAYDLDMQCIRLEPAHPLRAPATTADAATKAASKAYPTGYPRETLLVSFRDTCAGGNARLAWAVSVVWPAPDDDPLATGPQPRAIVVVDAATGQVVSNHNQRAPVGSPSPNI